MSSLQDVANPATMPVVSGSVPVSGRKGSAEHAQRLLHCNDEYAVHEMLGHLLRRAYADMTSAVGVEQMAEEPFVGAVSRHGGVDLAAFPVLRLAVGIALAAPVAVLRQFRKCRVRVLPSLPFKAARRHRTEVTPATRRSRTSDSWQFIRGVTCPVVFKRGKCYTLRVGRLERFSSFWGLSP